MKPVFFIMPGCENLGDRLATMLDAKVGQLELRQFPDLESYVRLDTDVSVRDVIIVDTLDRPDGKLLPLIFVASAARDLGCASVGLIAPYLPYMRQDRRFQPGEAVTSTHFAAVISRWVDWLVTVDPHLHRRSSLNEIYSIPSSVVHAASLVAAWIKSSIDDPLLVGPDRESEQWVSAVAEEAGAPYMVLEKIRRGDRDVSVIVPDIERWLHKTPVLVDDIISTARTMIETTGHLREAGLSDPVCIGVHAVFSDNAFMELEGAGAGKIITCNTIAHPSNAIDLSEPIAAAALEFLASTIDTN